MSAFLTFAEQLQNSRLYLVTPARPRAGKLDDFLARVLEAGVDVVQLRDKNLQAGLLMPFCDVVRRRTTQFGALFVINDRVDVAIACGADGVHLGQDDLPIGCARAQMGPDMFVGRSTHSPGQLDEGFASGADYCAVGPIFSTPTKPGRPAVGTGLIRYAKAFEDRPVFAIGGIDEANLNAVVDAGGRRACVVRALTEAEVPEEVARKLRRLLERAWR